MRGGPFAERLTPGINVDRIDVAAGMRALVECGYPITEVERHYVIQHALMRWSRGEEEAAQRGAIDKSFHGIDLTSWIRVLACARASAETQAAALKGESPSEGGCMTRRADYCPVGNEPCQSLCETPCNARKPLTTEQIDELANDGCRNAAGGIYATRVYEFARAIEAAHGIAPAGGIGGE